MAQNNDKKIDFIGIGAAKCGTTWVAQCLKEHPQILLPNKTQRREEIVFCEKELNFFNELTPQGDPQMKYEKGIDWYLEQFPPFQKRKLRGEFSVTYLRDQEACKRIKRHFPDVKIIVSLRNPVDVIFALYSLRKNSIYNSRALKDFDEVAGQGLTKELFIEDGLYYEYLKRYFDIFPAKNIHILIFDEIKSNPVKAIRGLYEFLGVRSDFIPSVLKKRLNVSTEVRFDFIRKIAHFVSESLRKMHLYKIHSWIAEQDALYRFYRKAFLVPVQKVSIKQETRDILKNYFRDDIEKLEELLGRNLIDWK